jgi:hypothetical protein
MKITWAQCFNWARLSARSGIPTPLGRPRRVLNCNFIYCAVAAISRRGRWECHDTLVSVCQGTIRGCTPRDRVAAVNALLDRGFGKPVQSMDLVMLGKKISELSTADLMELNARLSTGVGEAQQVPAEQQLH